MATVTEEIEVDVPLSTAYDQWTQFEEFPRFMDGVKSVTQLDDTRLRWVAVVAGKEKEWIAEIVEQVPDMRIAWRSMAGAENAGLVTFERINDDRTRVELRMDVEPEGLVEQAGTAAGFLQRQVKDDLKRFREFIESRGTETGAWRETVDSGTRT